MKKITFRRQVVLVVWMLLCGLSAQAADEDLITEQITINALEAGTLPQRISSSKKNLITNLKIIGEINGTDLKFIREMAGKDIKDHSTNGKLSILDLYDAKYATGFSPFGILRKRLWLLPHMGHSQENSEDTTKEITKAEEIRKEYFNNKNK